MTTDETNILAVDDRPENLLAVEEILRHPDWRIFKASSGNEALRLLLKHEFAVVLLDVQMPDMDGYETAQLMRSHDRHRAVPIIFMTAGDRSEERTFRGYEVGAVDFLHKPVNPVILKSKVDVFVEMQRASAHLKWLNGELEHARAQLTEKVSDLETLNRTLSHDLRAPLRSIQSFSQILAESHRAQLDAEGNEHVDRIVNACGRMQRMLDDLYRLLSLSRDTEGPPHTVDAEAVLRDLLADLRTDIERTATVVTHDPLPSLRANATLLRQVLQNLIDNAIKFRGENPARIHIRADRLSDAWQFSVRDNGVGIKPEHRERIFGVFTRLVGQSVPGTGVGLALVKKAVERLGGTIQVDSSPGQGCTFVFTIPGPETT